MRRKSSKAGTPIRPDALLAMTLSNRSPEAARRINSIVSGIILLTMAPWVSGRQDGTSGSLDQRLRHTAQNETAESALSSCPDCEEIRLIHCGLCQNGLDRISRHTDTIRFDTDAPKRSHLFRNRSVRMPVVPGCL